MTEYALPTTSSDLKKLSAEIREMIYCHNHALAIPHSDEELPALLMALAPDKVLFAEALKVYKRINVRVTKKNLEVFKSLRMTQLLRFNHLKIIYDGTYSLPYSCSQTS